MRVNQKQRLTFPPEITVTKLHWSDSCHCVFIVEPTVPWEEAFEEAYEGKEAVVCHIGH